MASAWLKFSFALLMFMSGATARHHRAKPSAHVVAKYLKVVSYPAYTVINDWSPSDPYSHLKGDMQYEDGKLIVPETGTYYIYAFLSFASTPGSTGRVQLRVNDDYVIVIGPGPGGDTSLSGIGTFVLNDGDTISLMINPWVLPEDGKVKLYMANYSCSFGAFKISA